MIIRWKGQRIHGGVNICTDQRESVLALALMHTTRILLTCVIIFAPPPTDPTARCGSVGQEGPQTYRILNSVGSSFGLYSVLLTEVSVLRDLEVTSLVIIWGPPDYRVAQGAPYRSVRRYVQLRTGLWRKEKQIGLNIRFLCQIRSRTYSSLPYSMWHSLFGYTDASEKPAFSYPDLNMETGQSSETSAHFFEVTCRYIPEVITLHIHRCKNVKCVRLL
jgi:hypothetical protein